MIRETLLFCGTLLCIVGVGGDSASLLILGAILITFGLVGIFAS